MQSYSSMSACTKSHVQIDKLDKPFKVTIGYAAIENYLSTPLEFYITHVTFMLSTDLN